MNELTLTIEAVEGFKNVPPDQLIQCVLAMVDSLSTYLDSTADLMAKTHSCVAVVNPND